MPEYALIMSQYVHICLNNTEYDWIYQNITEKKSAECQNSECVYAVQSELYKLLSSYRDRCIQNTVKHLRWSVLQKEQCLSEGAQLEFCQDRAGGLWN